MEEKEYHFSSIVRKLFGLYNPIVLNGNMLTVGDQRTDLTTNIQSWTLSTTASTGTGVTWMGSVAD